MPPNQNPNYRKQKRVTISDEAVDILRENRKSKIKITLNQLSTQLEIPFQKLCKNLEVLGLTKKRKEKPTSEFFDVDEFGKFYRY